MTEVKDRIQTPDAFATRQGGAESRRLLDAGELVLPELEIEKTEKILEVLRHPELQELIDQGQLTLGIVKPHVNEGKNLPEDDDEAAQQVIQEIGEENIVFTFATKLHDEEVADFYRDIREKYSSVVDESGKSIWDQIREFTQSGPLTFVLLRREQGDAVPWWRERMGATRPNEADPNSLRGKYAIQEKLPNNITHGSDSIESARREIGILANVVADVHQKMVAASQPVE